MIDIRNYIQLVESVNRQPSFAAIARSPTKFVETLRDVMIAYGEGSLLDDFDNNREIAYALKEFAAQYPPMIKNGSMSIYRGMEIPKDWNPEARGLGIFWTFDRNSAFRRKPSYVTLHGVVAENEIDHWRTLVSEFTALAEDEITLFPQSSIQLIKIEKNGVDILPQFNDKTFKADPAGKTHWHL